MFLFCLVHKGPPGSSQGSFVLSWWLSAARLPVRRGSSLCLAALATAVYGAFNLPLLL